MSGIGVEKLSVNDLLDSTEELAIERKLLLDEYLAMLRLPTGDGSKKRSTGAKPPWWRDPSHEGAIFSHITKWKRGEKVDPDSGAHPLVHAAWRCLAIAYQETYGRIDPRNK